MSCRTISKPEFYVTRVLLFAKPEVLGFFLLSQLVIESSPLVIGEVCEREGTEAGIMDLDVRATSLGQVLTAFTTC